MFHPTALQLEAGDVISHLTWILRTIDRTVRYHIRWKDGSQDLLGRHAGQRGERGRSPPIFTRVLLTVDDIEEAWTGDQKHQQHQNTFHDLPVKDNGVNINILIYIAYLSIDYHIEKKKEGQYP